MRRWSPRDWPCEKPESIAEGSTRSGIQRLVGFSRYFVVVDVIGLFAACMALTTSSVWNTFVVIYDAVAPGRDVGQKELFDKLVQQAAAAPVQPDPES